MPAEAYALVATFAVLSLVVGAVVAHLVGPRIPLRYVPLAILMPAAAAFGALYLVGHRLGWSFGPEIELYGFEVAIVSDLVFAIGAAAVAAVVQRPFVARLGRRAARPA
jgi:hypothetical protein